MSFSSILLEAVESVVDTFIITVSDKYNLDKNELKSIWDKKQPPQSLVETKPFEKNSKKLTQTNVNKTSEFLNVNESEVLLKCNKTELAAMCKSRGYKCSGTKTLLINRLLGKEECDTHESKIPKESCNNSTPVIKKLTSNIPNILIRRNKFNNYEHPETGFVFNNETKIVMGKQNDDGSVDPLTDDDIDKCNAFKFKFKIPANLDSKATLVDVKIDDLSEEEEDHQLDEEEELAEDDLLENDDVDNDDEEFEDYLSD